MSFFELLLVAVIPGIAWLGKPPTAVPASIITWCSSCAPMSVSPSDQDARHIGLWPHSNNLNVIAPAKTPFPNKVTFIEFTDRKIQTPVACKSLLYAHPHTVPRSPVVSAASEEESHGEASSSQTPSNQFDETLLILTVRREIKRARGAPREAWSSPILAKHVTKKLIRSHSVTPLHLEAAGTRINRHVRLQNQPSCNSRGDSAPLGPAARPSTAIGLCRNSQTPLASSEVPRSSSEPEREDRKAAPIGAQADPHRQSRPRGAPLSPAGGGAVAMAPEMLPKHPHPPGKRGPRVDASLHGNLAGASLPLLAGAPSHHLPSKRLIKVCSSPPARPRQRFHTVCSQAPPRPGVNAHLH
ncbi:uncharacterized protein C12orf42 homolog [Mirounga leonina]|uniref:uncharacterized protein C12orf42 homolog n=1 Tax=Mirounga leonina TaxID=9715 RepID=UPI00156C14DD|nr:uncharacterized protein C12orf42 homolog [Mirounga leonina]